MKARRDELEQQAMWRSETVKRIHQEKEREFKETNGNEAIYSQVKLIKREWFNMAKCYAEEHGLRIENWAKVGLYGPRKMEQIKTLAWAYI
jgi:hypothetical protein